MSCLVNQTLFSQGGTCQLKIISTPLRDTYLQSRLAPPWEKRLWFMKLTIWLDVMLVVINFLHPVCHIKYQVVCMHMFNNGKKILTFDTYISFLLYYWAFVKWSIVVVAFRRPCECSESSNSTISCLESQWRITLLELANIQGCSFVV